MSKLTFKVPTGFKSHPQMETQWGRQKERQHTFLLGAMKRSFNERELFKTHYHHHPGGNRCREMI